MAYDFDPRTTPAVYYGPRAHERYERNRYLLWPAYAYRVIAPKPRERDLNILQQAVLGLCLADDKRPDTMGKLLRIDPDLVALVLEELLQRGLIDPQCRITPQGEKVLAYERHEVEATMSYEVSYVFQDPWTGELWPRVVKDLAPIETRCTGDARYPQLIPGTKGAQRPKHAFAKLVNSMEQPSPPRADDILDAAARHRRARRGQQQGEDGETDDAVEAAVPDARHLERVTIISEEPQPLFLATFLYVVEHEIGQEGWFVCDPFGLGTSSFLRQRLVRHMNVDEALKREIDNLVKVEPQDQTNAQTWEDLMHGEVKRQLAGPIRFDEVFGLLLNMERARWQNEKKAVASERLDDVLIKASIALERLFRCLWVEHPPRDTWRVLMTADGTYREDLLNDLAARLGFRLPMSKKIVRIKVSGLRWAGEKGEGSLGQRIVVALLSAYTDPAHPLRKAAAEAPDLLDRLAEVMEYRDASAHDTVHSRSLNDVERQVDTTYRAVRLLAEKI